MTERNFAFVTSAIEYTQRFLPVIRRIEKDGARCFFVCHRRSEYLWLKEQGVSEESLLDTSGYQSFDYSKIDVRGRLAELEKLGPAMISNIIMMDRMIRHLDVEFSYRYLAYLDVVVTDFLRKNRVAFITGGHDSALQIMLVLIARKLGITWAMATSTRFPRDRYGFVMEHEHTAFMPMRPMDQEAKSFGKAYLAEYRQKLLKPEYFRYSDKIWSMVSSAPKYLKIFLQNYRYSRIDGGSVPSWYTNARLVKMYFRRRINMLLLRAVSPFSPPVDRPFALLTLHVQPESSIDVISSWYSDQIALIRQIRRALPVDLDFFVKAHPGDLGARGRAYFEEIKTIPGVRLITPHVDSRELLKKTKIVFSCAGTVCFEAGLMGVPAIVFAPIYFGKLPSVRFCQNPFELPAMIRELLEFKNSPKADEETEAFLAQLHASSVKGQFDAFSAPFSAEDFEGLADAYRRVFEYCESKPNR